MKKNNRLEASGIKIIIQVMVLLGLLIFSLSSVSAFNWTQDSLVGFWDFREGTGTTAKDIGMGRHNGALSGNAGWVTGKIGNATLYNSAGSVNVTYSPLLSLTSNYSIQAWVYANSTTSKMSIVDKSTSTTSNYFLELAAGGVLSFGYFNGGWYTVSSTGSLPTKTWKHIVATKNDTAIDLYIDGVLNNSASSTALSVADSGSLLFGLSSSNPSIYFNGSIDEVGIWNRTLNSTDVIDLYGNSYGLPFNATSPFSGSGISVSLTSPADSSIITSTSSDFLGTYLPIGYNLTNATYYIYDASGIFNQTTETVTGEQINTTTINIGGFTIASYQWNVLACGENSTGTLCSFASSNSTFTTGINIINSTYTTNAFETSYETFTSVISFNSSYSISSAYLIYNGTQYTATTSSTGGVATLSRGIDLPLALAQSEIRFFYWRLRLFDNINIYDYSTTTYNHTVNRTYFTECNATYDNLSLNFTVYQESNRTRIYPFDFINSAIYFWLGTGTIKRDYSFGQLNVNETNLCSYPSYRTFNIDLNSEYGSDGYVTRNILYSNESVSGLGIHIPLYLLSSTDSTTFIQKVQDSDQVPLENMYIHTQRYYPETNSYETVQVSKTGSDGKTIGFYKTETVEYRHVIKDENGTTLLTTGKQKIFAETVPYTLTFTIGEEIETPWTDLEESKDEITFTLNYNKTSNLVTYTYVHTEDTFESARLYVTKTNHSGEDIVICNTTSTISSSILTCDLSSYTDGDFVIKAYRDREGYREELIKVISIEISDSIDTFGKEGLFLAWFIILTAGMIFIWSPISGIWAVNFATIFVNIIGLAKFPAVYIFGMIVLSIILTVVLRQDRGGF